MSIKRIVKYLGSVKLAVVLIVALGVMTAWGTIVEAKFNSAETASKLVFGSWMLISLLGLFAINLIAVMVDRWPWKPRHLGFLLAHIGLLTLLVGALVTKLFGIDGSMRIALSESASKVLVSKTDLTLYSSIDATGYTKLDDREVDFFTSPPNPNAPLEFNSPEGHLRVVNYVPFGLREQKIVESKKASAGAALRFQIQNANVSVTDWLIQPSSGRTGFKDFGPAQIYLGQPDPTKIDTSRNYIVLIPDDEQNLNFEIHTARKPKDRRVGRVAAGETVETGWMGLVLRILKYTPRAEERIQFSPSDQQTPLTTAAIEVESQLDSRQPAERHWMAINSMLKLFTDQAVYVVTYANRQLPVGVQLKLRDFKVKNYPGTTRPASYESVVDLQDGSLPRTISMNEPLSRNGFTFYQSSFDEDEKGRPTASVFSVNKDPGRWIKYTGCLLVVFGALHLFYLKKNSLFNLRSRAAS